MKKNQNFLWSYATLFFSSFCLMAFEIIVSRMLAPYIGSSSLVWSGIIGFVMLGMTIGYYLGGKFSSRKPLIQSLVAISLFFLIYSFFYQDIFSYLQMKILNTKLLIIILTAIAVGPISYLIASLSPFLVSGIIKHKNNTNTSMSHVYMIGSIGAIFGTFSSTFLLIPYIQISYILLGISYIFLLLLIPHKNFFKLAALLVLFAFLSGIFLRVDTAYVFAAESLYNSIEVRDQTRSDGKILRSLYLDKTIQSEMLLEYPNELISPYSQYYNLPFAYLQDPQDFLMIGGGAYSYPKYFSKNYPELSMDVVEIDPKVTQIAKEYFSFSENEKMNVHTVDARVYVNNIEKQYDAILMDAFNGYSTPPHLATREYSELIYHSLNDDGVLVVNIPASLSGDYSGFLLTQYKMYKEIFSNVDLYTVLTNNQPNLLQNIMLVARKSDNVVDKKILDSFEVNRVGVYIDTTDVVILHDDYNPTDFLNRKFDTYFDYQKTI